MLPKYPKIRLLQFSLRFTLLDRSQSFATSWTLMTAYSPLSGIVRLLLVS